MGRGVRCVLGRFVYARETTRPWRAVMHASVSVEYECDDSLTAIAATATAAAALPRFTFLEYCLTSYCLTCDLCRCIFFLSTATLRCLSPSDAAAAAAFFLTVYDVMD